MTCHIGIHDILWFHTCQLSDYNVPFMQIYKPWFTIYHFTDIMQPLKKLYFTSNNVRAINKKDRKATPSIPELI